jgi:hypothetical protein
MTERLKDGQIVGIVKPEGWRHEKKLEINLAKARYVEGYLVLQEIDGERNVRSSLGTTEGLAIQRTFPELSSVLDTEHVTVKTQNSPKEK